MTDEQRMDKLQAAEKMLPKGRPVYNLKLS